MTRNSWSIFSLGRDFGSLYENGIKRSTPSVETSRDAEAAKAQTNTVFPQRDGERLLEKARLIGVRFHACGYNNQYGPLL
ncbi:hypothetical protein NPIL_302771 [Nephila pilipes]|uniref:Uncharacterized protein n=1 Tax=Nephila pilipes TaxID=299642 RepID=A0A8X6NPY4_NEPPI|nr:hypothetical protein NPIL_302771 [Nephila pilipes]